MTQAANQTPVSWERRQVVLSSVRRRRLEIQGFVGLDDARLAEVGPWLRLTPALCTVIVAAGTALALPALLWSLVPLAVLGAMFQHHPFDFIYNIGFRRLTGTGPLPPNGAPRRFVCGVAAVWIGATAAAFMFGVAPLGYALGAMFSAVALLVSTTDFCIPSLIYRLMTGTLRVQPT